MKELLKRTSVERLNILGINSKISIDESTKECAYCIYTKIIDDQSNEIKQLNEFIAKQKEQLKAIITGLGDEIVMVDKHGTYLGISDTINNEICVVGKNYKEIYNEMEVYDSEDNVLSLEETCIARALKGEKVKNLKLKSVRKGKIKYLDNTGIPIFNKDNKLEFVIRVSHDITAEVRTNIIMEKALKSQEELIVNISHELKTPLNVIYSAAQLFNTYCDSGSLDKKKGSIIKYIGSIKKNCYRLTKLINNIVDSSKIEAGFFKLKLSNNNIVKVVEDIVMSVTSFSEIKGLNIIFDTDIEEKIIACDPEKIERIVLNLISNAIKFSNEGDEIFINIKNKDEFVEISITDNGIGLEKKDLDIIFDRFKQVGESLSRNVQGTGIGLSLVKSIVELHNGRIYVESEVGKGSKFTVIFPTRIVQQGNVMCSKKISSKNEIMQLELSDITL